MSSFHGAGQSYTLGAMGSHRNFGLDWAAGKPSWGKPETDLEVSQVQKERQLCEVKKALGLEGIESRVRFGNCKHFVIILTCELQKGVRTKGEAGRMAC